MGMGNFYRILGSKRECSQAVAFDRLLGPPGAAHSLNPILAEGEDWIKASFPVNVEDLMEKVGRKRFRKSPSRLSL